MHRLLRLMVIAVLAGALIFTFWLMRSGTSHGSRSVSLKSTVRSALANPVEFAKKRLTGGIGVTMTTDPQSGLPAIGNVLRNSPAHKAGLLERDVVLKIDGFPTTSKPLTLIASEIRGITAGKVTLTVQRSGSTNRDYTIQRNFWNTMEQNNR